MGRRQNKTLIKADRIDHLDVARVHNPRYLISRDGVEVGIFPGFNALLAINAARKIYGAGKYTSTKTAEAMYLGRGALETERREREAQAARAAAKAAAKRDKIQLPKGTRTRRTANAEFDGMPKSIEFGAKHRRTIDFGRRKRGAERDLVMAYADHLLRAVLAQNWALDDPALYLELSSKAKTAAKRKHKIDPTRAALLLDQAEEIMQGERRNPAEKDAEHPIEVTRHFRGGPPGYLSPWQKAMAIGQAELFDTGIKLAPRAAELRAARLSNPGATKPVYQSGLKQATAAQLGRLARVGLRVGRTPTEIRSDLVATDRFTAEQIRRGLDQATTAERRENPPLTDKQLRRIPKAIPATRAKYQQLLKEYLAKVELLREVVTAHHFFVPAGRGKPTRATMAAAKKAATQYFREELFDIVKKQYTRKFPDILDEQISNFEQYYRNRRGSFAWEWYPLEWREYWKKKNPPSWYKFGLTDKARRRTKRNPPVREIYQTFNGRLATRENSVDAPRGTPARVAQLGRLRLIRTRDGKTWKFPGDRAPFLAADSRGKLHVVGGAYRANPAGESCGEIEQIEYQTSKPHLGHENETIYYHQLGEETGVMPELEITPEGHLKIVGGDYRIEADGIHN